MPLPPPFSKWWYAADQRRQSLINRNHKKDGLTEKESEELRMLQGIRDLVAAYESCVFCRLCGGLLEIRDLGYSPMHSCKKKRSAKLKPSYRTTSPVGRPSKVVKLVRVKIRLRGQ